SWVISRLGSMDSFFSENFRANISTRGTVSGHYECQVNLFVNCGAVTSSFAFLVIAIIAIVALVFGIYATRQYWQSPTHREEAETPEYFGDRKEKVVEDEEGWETKAFEDKEDREKKDDD